MTDKKLEMIINTFGIKKTYNTKDMEKWTSMKCTGFIRVILKKAFCLSYTTTCRSRKDVGETGTKVITAVDLNDMLEKYKPSKIVRQQRDEKLQEFAFVDMDNDDE